MKKINWKILIVCLVAVYAVAFIGSFFTSPNVSTSWYESTKPSITPPNWVFPVVWNILFFLIALSLYFSLLKDKFKSRVVIVFGINFLLNILWSVFYFEMQKPVLAFYDLILLWLSIISMMSVTYKIDKKSFWLLLPYLLWVSFAGVLNYFVAF